MAILYSDGTYINRLMLALDLHLHRFVNFLSNKKFKKYRAVYTHGRFCYSQMKYIYRRSSVQLLVILVTYSLISVLVGDVEPVIGVDAVGHEE